ncbi:OVARIAN TUMOR DOMAIN-containing deubiquitinating enzyme 4-like [Actinidia eriantha]|uniref:OVARIAN TUMOR DOMAIN-containing deubiquitinating enzyme 4-like n=1 Tax=Actinidia eriantha TaxID=165200 RepID=UPI00258878D7|nr:OVARIAN TUMOR DOMAIN-containing deubiquitinating enzyme 4-like [Actinidia eriantha]XP_057468087.1 OVARIAN TUMOR DOMAIN-containing deubiquitinating enzyme 4-like [Actinidia eriantha]XP_057468088.1 OVARIAN TUMOR DOMAIN-containing deubiquitinating enzyme 4-like [Actinidia eriantha]
MVCSLFSTYLKNVIRLRGCAQRQMSNHMSGIVPQSRSSSCCYYISTGYCKPKYTGKSVTKRNSCSTVIGFQASQGNCLGSFILKQRSNWHSLTVKNKVNFRQARNICFDFSSGCRSLNVKLSVPNQGIIPKIKCNVGPLSWPRGCASTGLIFGLLVCFLTYEPVHAEAAQPEEKKEDSSVNLLHGKKVYIDYSIIGIPGDGRCLFRSVAHGACLRSGKPAPNEGLQKELADDLRARVADEFVNRRKETEWFVEGDFDTYISQMRKPHVWGGEPELFMASHVLQTPITVYMYNPDSGGLITIAEYGQEYGKENPIKVLYHGFGHYDALQIPEKKGAQSRL